MFQHKQKIIPLLLFSTAAIQLSAQSTVLSGGGGATDARGAASFSIGQVAYTAAQSGSGSNAAGVQQPWLPALLPVTLLDFTATKQQGKAILKWQTANEANSQKFVVERSSNGLHYSSLAEVDAAGNSTLRRAYSAQDLHPLSGINYYRIKMVDKDGSSRNSHVQSLNFDKKATAAVVFPTLARHHVWIKLTDVQVSRYVYGLYNANGSLLRSERLQASETNVSLQHLPAGAYYIALKDDQNQQITTFKIVKTN